MWFDVICERVVGLQPNLQDNGKMFDFKHG